MMHKDQDQTPPEPNKVEAEPAPEPRRPDDRGSVHIDGFVRIFDPNTQQVFLETRT